VISLIDVHRIKHPGEIIRASAKLAADEVTENWCQNVENDDRTHSGKFHPSDSRTSKFGSSTPISVLTRVIEPS
jgi:hypothetical protein